MHLLNNLSDTEIIDQTKRLVAEERKVTLEILWHLREISSRRIYAKRGHTSLYEYCLRELNYSAGAAFRRIKAMQFLKTNPEVEVALQAGNVSLTTVSALENFIQTEKKTAAPEEKRALLKQIEGKSKIECEKLFLELSPNYNAILKEKEKLITPSQTQITFLASEKLMKNLKRIKELSAHQNPSPSYCELLEFMSEFMLKEIDPLRLEEKGKKKLQNQYQPTHNNEKPISLEKSEEHPVHSINHDLQSQGLAPDSIEKSKPLTQSRYIPKTLRAAILKRDHYQCAYIDPETNQKCGTRFGLEIDHKKPWSMSGDHSPSNLRALCKTHNILEAIHTFGETKMAPFLKSV